MDVTSVIIAVAIAGYLFFEYRRREEEQREVLAYLGKGERPPEKGVRVEGWKLFTTGGVTILLLAATGWLGWRAVAAHPKYATPLIVMAGIGGLLAGFVALVFAKNLSGVLESGRTGRGGQ